MIGETIAHYRISRDWGASYTRPKILRGKINGPKDSQDYRTKKLALVVVLSTAWQAQAQDAKASYPSMAPLDQYLMTDRNAEIAMARSAAPEAISRDADVLVLGTAWLRNRSQRQERFRVCRGARVDGPIRW